MKKSFTERFNELLIEKKITQSDLSKITGITQSSISDWSRGKYQPKQDKIDVLASALGVTPAYLMGWTDSISNHVDNVISLVPIKKIPVLGKITYGEAMLVEENYSGYFLADDLIQADFIIKAKDDSMIDAGIKDGDLAFFKKQATVKNGDIAAVYYEGETCLKRVYKDQENYTLLACNTNYSPITINDDLIILGKLMGVFHYCEK